MKYPLLYQEFKRYINLPIEAYHDIEKRLIYKTLNNKEFLIQEGQIIRYLPFINKGLMINYRINENGENHVLQIRRTGSWLGDLVYFNTPMKKGQALKHIQLIDAEGNIDNHAFMEFKQELWSRDGKRLTVLFDPGRIKRGVATNMLRGPALLRGKQYNLSISGAWQDVYGQQLSEETTKEIEVVHAYRHQIKVNEWVIDKPKANCHDTLTIQFDRIMDHALIQSMIQLVDAEKKLIAGYWEISEKEQVIQFIPEKKWKKGAYRIVIDSRLEDVAGNNLQNLLDHNKTDEDNNSHLYQFIEFSI